MIKRTFLLSLFVAITGILFSQKKLSNELVWTGGFSSKGIQGLKSMNDGAHYTAMVDSDAFGSQIVKRSYATGDDVKVIASSKDIFNDATRAIEDYEFSIDEKQIIVSTGFEPIYRYSYKAQYYVYNTETKKTTAVADETKGKQMFATLSPDGTKVAFVRDNNLFVQVLATSIETQVTTDGEWNKIINGAPDWVYEEEFALVRSFEWSPNSDRIAFYKFNEERVKEFSIDMYGNLYPEQYTYKYPKAGEENSIVSIHVYDLKTLKSRPVDIGTESDQYIPRIKWSQSNDGLCIMRMNRHQSKLEFLLTDMKQNAGEMIPVKTIFSETANTYIDISDNLTFLPDGKSYLWTSERDSYNHVYVFDMTGTVVHQVTSGNWDVMDFYGVGEKGIVYYSSSEISAMEKHVFSISILPSRKSTKKQLSTRSGTNDATFSSSKKYFINFNSQANTPPYITLNENSGKEIRMLENNQKLTEKLKEYTLAKKEFFSFDNGTGTSLNCWMMKPADFDPFKKYPVLVAIYGGPGSNTVNDSWGGTNYMWHQLLCQEGFIVVSCDPRGTMNRGRDFKHSTYMNLGKLETEDFIDFAEYLGAQTYIDKARIGMHGWSYGGYMTSLCMTKGADVYAAGIAVAPVTNWKYYDSIYTERFMRTPQENSGGYENNSPINFADQLKGDFMLVHGSADDNVHYQNTMDMISALVKANKQFDLFIYPNKNHGIYGGNTRLHLFTRMTDFLKENL
ncbi:MAG: S9 family peptidase [Flavobacteriales bacterium]|nr:S9 family peptidase [Flavobacteriales bacterium]